MRPLALAAIALALGASLIGCGHSSCPCPGRFDLISWCVDPAHGCTIDGTPAFQGYKLTKGHTLVVPAGALFDALENRDPKGPVHDLWIACGFPPDAGAPGSSPLNATVLLGGVPGAASAYLPVGYRDPAGAALFQWTPFPTAPAALTISVMPEELGDCTLMFLDAACDRTMNDVCLME